ncbi:MAG: hypothetical protein JWP64_5591 [Pseudonocardia sp.]|jgi:hypothetical protein|nr:hypothetical protein [Pseudonocardia sp.]
MFAGFTPAGRRVRAHCTCGDVTTPRVDERRALDALECEHGTSRTFCDLCGRDRSVDLTHRNRFVDLRLLVDERTGDQLLVCADDEQACRELAAQHQVELDRAALGVETPRPTLRVIDGGRLSGPGGMVPG